MQGERPPPARPWFDLVTERIAVRGWSVAELARRAHVSRPTIYGWRENPGKPQAAPVNAVADLLGIPRERALRLAGVIADAPQEPGEASQSAPTPLEELFGADGAEDVRHKIRIHKGADADWYISAIESALSAPPAGECDPQSPDAGRARRQG